MDHSDRPSQRPPLSWAARKLQRYAELESEPVPRAPRIMSLESVGIALDSRMVHDALGRPLDDEIRSRDAPVAVRECVRRLFRHAAVLAHRIADYTPQQVQLFSLLRDNMTVSYRLVKERRNRLFMLGMQVAVLPEEASLASLEIVFRMTARNAGLFFDDKADVQRFTVRYDLALPPEENPVAGLDEAENTQRMARAMTTDATMPTDELLARMDALLGAAEAARSAEETSLWSEDDEMP